jgi:adenine-specific DNA methylase
MSYTYTQHALDLDAERGDLVDATDQSVAVEPTCVGSLEASFDPVFAAPLALREKQIQQNYRPIIGVHKWFARRPGTLFRNLLLAEFVDEPPRTSYWRGHSLEGVIADPFIGGGSPIFEANRLGFSVVGTDINPMAYWVVRQSLAPLDLCTFSSAADSVVKDVERELGDLYRTRCLHCGQQAIVKYFLWVKVESCPQCGTESDLFPGYLLAEATRHPKHVVACSVCGTLNEYDRQPTRETPETCVACGSAVSIEGPARRGRICCRGCEHEYSFPRQESPSPPVHRMWAIEYHCSSCCAHHKGRFFKKPDADDHARFDRARAQLVQDQSLPIPEDEIPPGDETDRLHRWGYQRYREMFNERQLLGLGRLFRRICALQDEQIRHALLTVFSDFLRYQNMLCRYDTYALKCQDIFSVHGFPVGLIPCENNLLGIPRVGSGSFRHFVEKYLRAKRYCEAPFETRQRGSRKEVTSIPGERIAADLVEEFPEPGKRQAYLLADSAIEMQLPPASLDGVFTDPPYFDNVQYAELMDFCYAWLRQGLADAMPQFRRKTTRTPDELTGNTTLGRGLEHFTAGLSAVFQHYAAALKPGAPFVFTYHHNDPSAYVPLVVAILDAQLDCTATLPAVAEMSASLHISGTGSSVLDSVFVCRAKPVSTGSDDLEAMLRQDAKSLKSCGMRLTAGDLRCLAAGHIARLTVNLLSPTWDRTASLTDRMKAASECVLLATNACEIISLVENLVAELSEHRS